MTRASALRFTRNLLLLVGILLLARIADGVVDGYANAVLPHSFSGSLAIFFGILLLGMPTLLVFTGASMLLCIALDTPRRWPWSVALGTLPILEWLALNVGPNLTSWELEPLSGTAFILALTAPLAGAALGCLAWRRLTLVPTPTVA